MLDRREHAKRRVATTPVVEDLDVLEDRVRGQDGRAADQIRTRTGVAWAPRLRGRLRDPLPFSDERDLPPDELAAMRERGEPVGFSHSLQAQIGGQLAAGFSLTHLVEASRGPAESPAPIGEFLPSYIATRARKPNAI